MLSCIKNTRLKKEYELVKECPHIIINFKWWFNDLDNYIIRPSWKCLTGS
jgi:hypothetical protein